MPLCPVAFPLFPIVDGACGCSFEGCTRIGKHPAVLWRDLAFGDAVPRPVEGAGVGLKTGAAPKGSGVFVVDLDGDEAAAHWLALGGEDEGAETYTVQTPRGWHLYFEHPGFHVKNSASDLGKGIDIRGDGGFVVAAGSPHRSGGTYELVTDVPVLPAPAWLLDWLRLQKAPAEIAHYSGDVEGEERDRRLALYRKYLETAPPSVAGDCGDLALFGVVQHGAYDLALPAEDVLDLVAEVFDPRCDPPWGDELERKVLHKIESAKTASTRPAMPPLPADLEHLARGSTFESAQAQILETYAETFRKLSESANADTVGKSPIADTKQDGPIVWGGWDVPISEPVYLLGGLIPEGKVCTFFAEGGSLKTWAAFSLAIAVATGEPWLGSFPVQKGKALYLDYEDGRYEFQRRIRILQGLQDIPDLGYWQYPPPLDDVGLWKQLAPLGLKLIVVDALSSGVSADVDENDRTFSNAVKMGGRLTELGCTVVFVHHANKQGGMRGSSTVRDQSDVVFKFEPVSETDSTKRMRMVCDKPGPQKRPAPVNVELSDAGLATFEDEANKTGRNGRTIDDVQAAVLLALQDKPMGVEALRVHLQSGKARVQDAVKILLEENRIVRADAGGFELDDDDRRRARVWQEADTFAGTKAGLAARARVRPTFVDSMLDDGDLLERVKGQAMGFIVP